MHKITLIKGDGIGPEIAEATIKIIEKTGVKITWEEAVAGQEAHKTEGDPLPEKTIASIRQNRLALKGPLTTQVGKGFRSINVALRQEFGLFANLRPVRSFSGVKSLYQDLNLVVVRENTEDLYAGIERQVGADQAESIKVITRKASEKIARFAFDYAIQQGRKKVTAIHKANIMKLSDGLFLESVRGIASGYSSIFFNDLIVDNAAMQLVLNPYQFDVIVAPNLYGDILSDLCAGLIGGLGLAPAANIGDEVSIFEPVHGSAPDLAGKKVANPTAMVLSAVLMLRQIGETDAADRIEKAIAAVIKKGRHTTPDLGGSSSTLEMADAVIAEVEKG
ncbi:MAG: isocitrate/isopropylmalate dehydrogenase family protein [Firmicutes bacterium]|nr:isocitrate/isopropylmalate dehydrogenase family protein [Bacillota bacterium]